jgi:hypothetical protein
VHINAWQMRNDDARKADQRILNKQLLELERNQQRMMETLSKLDRPALGIPTNPFVIDMHQDNVMAMMVSLQRRLDHISDGDQERQFFSHALRYLITTSGRQVEMESWMITSYEVEFGPRIGSGGLYVFLLVSVSSALCPPGL